MAEQFALARDLDERWAGRPRFLVRPHSPDALVATLGVLADAAVGWMTLGNGSDTIVGDGRRRRRGDPVGPDSASTEVEEVRRRLGHHSAGAPPPASSSSSAEQNGVGVGLLSAGIPGSIGGMVALNAGTPAAR